MNKIYFYKDITGRNYEAAHVYEHIFTNAFREYAEENGFIAALYGWISGSIYYDAAILLECEFYDSRAEKLFRDFLTKKIDLSNARIKRGIATVSAEYRSDIEITDPKTFRADMEEVAKAPFLSLDNSLTMKQYEIKQWQDNPKIAKITDNKKGFRKITVSFDYTGKSLGDMVLILRFWPILADNVQNIIHDMNGYPTDMFFPMFMQKTDYLNASLVAHFRREKGLKKKLENKIEKMRSGMDFTKLGTEIEIFIDNYKNNLTFAHTQENFMDDAGILVSRNKIAELFTPENVQRVWDSLELQVK